VSARYFPAAALTLRPDVPGARYWAVALDHAMLTYFEVEPGVRFETHRHEAEQITWVLEGELCFEVEGRVTVVQAGDAIAVPSNVPHAVFTRARAARAVDAWSPVPPQYRQDAAP
jgi:quercetin dioxygenase-like cupin family protein